MPAKPGRPQRYDHEYERGGTTNLFAFFEPEGGFRRVEVSQRRTAKDFALAAKLLVDDLYPQAETIRLVLDNLNTHTPAALHGAFEPAEAGRIARKLEFHYPPKHASWLNQVEVELSVLHKQCPGGRRIPGEEMLAREVGAWERESVTREERR